MPLWCNDHAIRPAFAPLVANAGWTCYFEPVTLGTLFLARLGWLPRAAMSSLIMAGLLLAALAPASQPGLVRSEFIFATNPVPSCHASTIVETPDHALVAAWFGGSREGHADVGIWSARWSDGQWTAPVPVAVGTGTNGMRLPCYNPVLFQPREGPLLLFYKVGPNPEAWWGMRRSSDDGGRTWSAPRRLPDGILGPIKNKPVQLADGTLVCGSSVEGLSPRPEWQIHFERTTDLGLTWERVTVAQPPGSPPAIQPAILQRGGDRLQALGRTTIGKLFTTASEDGGRTWSRLTLLDLPNPNSGIDAVTLHDGRHLLVYNHTTRGRSPLNVAISRDGRSWDAALVLEDEPGAEFSYPAVIESSDHLVHATYTWKRRLMKHAVIDPDQLETRPLIQGAQ